MYVSLPVPDLGARVTVHVDARAGPAAASASKAMATAASGGPKGTRVLRRGREITLRLSAHWARLCTLKTPQTGPAERHARAWIGLSATRRGRRPGGGSGPLLGATAVGSRARPGAGPNRDIFTSSALWSGAQGRTSMTALGKITPDEFDATIAPRLGARRDEVLLGPGVGRDSALVRIGAGRVMAVTTDPLDLIPAFGAAD